MKPIKDLITQPEGACSTPLTKKSEVTDGHIAYLWRCMVMFYGYRWLNSYGASDDGTWLACLKDVTPEQILHGIDTCRLSGKEWPPTLPEFRKMCVPIVVPYHTPYKALEQTKDWDKLQRNWKKLVDMCHAGK